MSHGHHHHVDPDSSDGKIALAVAINLGLTVAQVIGGIVAGSLSLIADALHNFSDAIALIIAFAARKIARRPANADMTFGYGRIEAVAALINYTTLIVIGLYLVYEAAMRFANPEPVAGWIVVIVAGFALLVDLGTAALTFRASKSSVNIRAAFMHNLADAMGSLAVILAGALIWAFGWTWVDPAITLLIAGYILWMAWSEIGGVIRILMLGSPPRMAPENVLATAEAVEGVAGLHHAHLWQMDEHQAALQAHMVIETGAWAEADAIKQTVKARLEEAHGLTHVTLEMECASHVCSGVQRIGH